MERMINSQRDSCATSCVKCRISGSPLSGVNDKIRDKILSLFPKKQAKEIYHYTSLTVLWRFLANDYDFLCTYCRALSDHTEFLTGMSACVQMLRGMNEDLVEQLRDAVAVSGNTGVDFFPWMMSFSIGGDETFLWEHYTDNQNGGCSIGFNTQKLINDIKSVNGITNDSWCLVSLLPCIYIGYDDENKINKLFMYAMTEVADELARFFKVNDDFCEDENSNKMARTLIFLLLSSIMKHKGFKDEQEWRLIIQPMDVSKLLSYASVIGGKLRLKSGVWGGKRKVFKCIDRIVISPQGSSDTLRDSANMMVAVRELQKEHDSVVVSSLSPWKGLAEASCRF